MQSSPNHAKKPFLPPEPSKSNTRFVYLYWRLLHNSLHRFIYLLAFLPHLSNNVTYHAGKKKRTQAKRTVYPCFFWKCVVWPSTACTEGTVMVFFHLAGVQNSQPFCESAFYATRDKVQASPSSKKTLSKIYMPHFQNCHRNWTAPGGLCKPDRERSCLLLAQQSREKRSILPALLFALSHPTEQVWVPSTCAGVGGGRPRVCSPARGFPRGCPLHPGGPRPPACAETSRWLPRWASREPRLSLNNSLYLLCSAFQDKETLNKAKSNLATTRSSRFSKIQILSGTNHTNHSCITRSILLFSWIFFPSYLMKLSSLCLLLNTHPPLRLTRTGSILRRTGLYRLLHKGGEPEEHVVPIELA